MKAQWSLKVIDLTSAIEVIASQNPETSLRVNLPIPNWLDEAGKSKYRHPDVGQKDDGAWRYFFTNKKDGCLQNVEIDGTSVITFMGATPAQAKQIIDLVNEYGDAEKLTPATLTTILERVTSELGIVDMYDNGRRDVDFYMHPYLPVGSDHKYLGAFLPTPNLSTAVYLPGDGEFLDGPTSTPQHFDDGAFISFPGQTKANIMAMSADDLKIKGNARLVQPDVFISSRTYTDGSQIDAVVLAKLPVRQGLKRSLAFDAPQS